MYIRSGRLEEALSLAERTAQGSAAAGDLLAEGIAERSWAQAIAALGVRPVADTEGHFASSIRALEETEACPPV